MDRKIHPLKARNRFKARLLFGMVLKPLRLFCEHCDKYLPSDMEWRCAHCGHENLSTRIYSFLNKCQQCKRSPKSVACPQPGCGKLNFLDKDKDGSHPAVKNSAPAIPPLSPEQLQAQERTKHRVKKSEDHTDRREDISREIEIARLDAELSKWKASAESFKKKSPLDQLKSDFEQRKMHAMGVHEIAANEYALNKETFKDDPEKQEQADTVVKNWAEDKAGLL